MINKTSKSANDFKKSAVPKASGLDKKSSSSKVSRVSKISTVSKVSKISRRSENSLNARTNRANDTREGKVVKTTMFANQSLDIIRNKIIHNRSLTVSNNPQKMLVSSEKEILKELEEMKITDAIKKNMKTIRKNKSFLGLVDTWKFKVLEIANNLTDYVPAEENRMKIKKTLNSKIRKFRVDNVPLNKPRYSS